MAFKFKYAKKLDELEEIAESKTGGHFSGVWTIVLTLLRSRYFLISLCFYVVLLMILGGVVVSHYVVTRGTFEEGAVLILPSGPPGLPPGPRGQPSAAQAAKQTRQVSVSVQTMSRAAAKTAAKRITISAPSAFVRVEAPVVAPPVQIADVKVDTQMAKNIADANIKRLQGVRDFQKGWGVSMGGAGGRGGGGGSGGGSGGGGGGSGSGGGGGGGRGGTYHGVRAKFIIFQAKYQDGDWDCNGGRGTNLWDQSALKNLMFQIRQWSKDRIDAQVTPAVLDIGTDEIFTLKPPFVYLTGHKDFHFLDREVKNLRDYLTLGGCVWADSALAGRRSRFDIAFRREIKKVLPDRDFEIVKPDHEMFNTFFENVDLPTGINFYQEPIEMINIGEELAVLYTLNGYGHFWESRLNRDGKIEESLVNLGEPGKPHWVSVYGYQHRYSPRSESGTLYRNLTDNSVRDNYKFGINAVVHLLTRYQKHFRFLPKELPVGEGMKKPVKKEEELKLEETPEKAKPKRVHHEIGSSSSDSTTNQPADKKQ